MLPLSGWFEAFVFFLLAFAYFYGKIVINLLSLTKLISRAASHAHQGVELLFLISLMDHIKVMVNLPQKDNTHINR
jgi:hypothetical protein